MSSIVRPLSILHLHLELGEQSCANQFCFPSRHRISIVTFFRSEIRVSPDISLFEGDGSVRGFNCALKAALAARRYDVVHAHGPVDGFLFLAFALLRRERVAPTVFTAHHSFSNSNLKVRNRLLLIPIFARFDRVTCVGEASLKSFPAPYRWLAGNRLTAIPNGVDLKRVDQSTDGARPARTGNPFTVVSVGRLIAIKNPLTVLEAFRQGTKGPCRLTFVGWGHLSGVLLRKQRAIEAGRQVQLLGLIPRNRVYRVLAAADLYVSASRGEGMPMAVLEAMACRCPVILSDIPPHREIAAGVDFIPLVPPDDVAGLAREISKYRRMPLAKRLEIGERCRALVEQRFSLTAMHSKFEKLYLELLNGQRSVSEKSG
jgi:glycosyltransferase involved in cell wall biosynthesis